MKMIRGLVCACGTALMLTPVLAASEGGGCGDDDLTAVTREVEHTLGLPQQTLFVTERDDLSGSLIDLQYLAKTSGLGPREPGVPLPVARVRVFELALQGHRLQNGNLVGLAVDLDGVSLWRVGYDCATKAVLHLYGFADSTEGFNDLIRNLHLKVNSVDLALEVQSTFVKLTYRNGNEDAIRNRLGLMKAALNNYGGRASEDAFLAFWAKCPIDVKRKIAPPSALPSGNGFTVTFFASTEEAVQRVSMFIEPDGRIRSLDCRAIYPWPSAKAPPGRYGSHGGEGPVPVQQPSKRR